MRPYLQMLIIAVCLQGAAYLFLDRYLFVPQADFTQETVAATASAAIDPRMMSADQRYWAEAAPSLISFYSGDRLPVKEIPLGSDEAVTFFAWVPDTHVALIGLSREEGAGSSVTLKSINMDLENEPVEPQISGLFQGSEIVAVAFSPQTNVTYMLISGPTTNLIYRTDANNRLARVLSNPNITRIACLQSVDTLLMYNQADRTIYTRNMKGFSHLKVPPGGNYGLIGSDQNDQVYIGRLNDSGLVTEILWGTITGDFLPCKTLAYPADIEDIHVDYDGRMRVE